MNGSTPLSGAERPVPGRRVPWLSACIIVLGGLLAAASASASGVYKWVDDQGKVHYGDRPPAAAEPTEVELEEKPVPSAADTGRQEKTQRLLDAIESERERKKKATAREAANSAQRKRNCAIAKRRVETFDRANNISIAGDDGERKYLDDNERASAMKQARQLVREWC